MLSSDNFERILLKGEVSPASFDLKAFLKAGFVLSEPETGEFLLATGPFSPARDFSEGLLLSVPHFDFSNFPAWLEPSSWCRMTRAEFLARLSPSISPEPIRWNLPNRDEFQAEFDELSSLIQKGHFQKLVPVVFSRAETKVNADFLKGIFWTLAPQASNLFVYGYWDASEGLLGITPELFFRKKGSELKSMALAGTLSAAKGSSETLFASAKDQKEHAFVVRELVEKLKNLGELQVSETYVWSLPLLHHLRTNVSVQRRKPLQSYWEQGSQTNQTKDLPVETIPSKDFRTDCEYLIQLLHPTPALGGSPSKPAWDWLLGRPAAHYRKRFGAPFGYTLAEESLFVVGIRNIQWTHQELLLGAGCGVVKESVFDNEWKELLLKMQFTRKLMNL